MEPVSRSLWAGAAWSIGCPGLDAIAEREHQEDQEIGTLRRGAICERQVAGVKEAEPELGTHGLRAVREKDRERRRDHVENDDTDRVDLERLFRLGPVLGSRRRARPDIQSL